MKGFEELDTSDPARRAEYERAFYEAFVQVTSNRLIRQLWLWDDSRRRLATRIGYADQSVFVLRDDNGQIRVAFALNRTLAEFQSAAFGFAPTETGDHVFEFLAFFAPPPRPPRSVHHLSVAVVDRLKAQGYRVGFATTAPSFLPFYLRLGFRVLAERVISGETRYFIRLLLDEIDLPRLDAPLPVPQMKRAENGVTAEPKPQL
jgi:hypothetical protein